MLRPKYLNAVISLWVAGCKALDCFADRMDEELQRYPGEFVPMVSWPNSSCSSFGLNQLFVDKRCVVLGGWTHPQMHPNASSAGGESGSRTWRTCS